MRLFGKAKAAEPVNPIDKISSLRQTLSLLEKREDVVQKRIDRETAEAQRLLRAKNKRGAMLCLKRRKTFQGQIEKLQGARMTLEQQLILIEDASVNREVMQAMREGADAIKEIQGGMTLEQVDDTMEDIREQMDIANEISEAIAQPIGVGAEFDEDLLNEELDLLEQETLDAELMAIDKARADAGGVRTDIGASSSAVPSAQAAASGSAVPAGQAAAAPSQDTAGLMDQLPAAPSAAPARSAVDDELAKLENEFAM
jgi:charged multivesicular body protein 4